MAKVALIRAEVLEGLRRLSAESVHCCITSPPYWGLRDYGVPGQLGLEKTSEEYIEKMVGVFREVRRVMRKDGTLWLNMGDSYAHPNTGGHGATGGRDKSTLASQLPPINTTPVKKNMPINLKPKDLCGIPWRMALALQADGWWLRSDIIWHKPNPMPESCTDRPTTSHEHIFLLTKAAHYYYDANAVREPHIWGHCAEKRNAAKAATTQKGRELREGTSPVTHQGSNWGVGYSNGGRNLRSVWTLSTEPFPEAHFATFPTSIPERCIKAGTSEKGCCPKCGALWKRVTGRVGKIRIREGSDKSGGTALEFAKGKHGTSSIFKTGEKSIWETTGWFNTCKCPKQEPISCTVLDPFSGAATTLMVAAKLGRDAIGIELNPAYVEMSVKRLKKELGMLMDLEVK